MKKNIKNTKKNKNTTYLTELDKLRIKQFILKYISSTSILSITTIFTPNFHIDSFPILLLSSLVIVLLDYMLGIVTDMHDKAYSRGFISFITAAIIIYITQFIVIGYYISIPSSLIAAAIYGVISGFIPNEEESINEEVENSI